MQDCACGVDRGGAQVRSADIDGQNLHRITTHENFLIRKKPAAAAVTAAAGQGEVYLDLPQVSACSGVQTSRPVTTRSGIVLPPSTSTSAFTAP